MSDLSINLFRNETNIEAYKAGETIFATGDSGDVMYVVREGEVQISVEEHILDVCGEGMIFGEMALIDDSPRSASAIAKTDVTLVPVNQRKFTTMIGHTPFFAIQVMRVMADRLRRTTEDATQHTHIHDE